MKPFISSPLLICLALFLLCSVTPAGCGGARGPEQEGEERAEALDAAARGWNVVLISVDTLRADRLNTYGNPRPEISPRIDALLSSGVRFERAMAPRSITWPSLASVLTGLYPSGHGVIENGYGFPDDLPTLPKVLQEQGYRTAAFLSNMCQANHQGWDAFACTGGQDGKTVRNALGWADGIHGEAASSGPGEPYFLWVHLFGAHSPYYNGGALPQTLNPGYEGDLVPKKWRLNAIMENSETLADDDIRHLDAIYDAAVHGSDRSVGRLLDGLGERGLLEKTVLVFLSDHGEDLYQHNGYLYHACSVYQSSLHVPLGIAAPGLLPEAVTVPQAVELVDVAPTLLDLLGIASPAGLHGVSLRRYLERPGSGGRGKPAFSEYGDTRIHTVMADGWTLIDNPDELTPRCFAGGPPDLYPIASTELYHLDEDPREQTNLATSHPAKVAELRSLIRRRFASLSNRAEEQELSEELKKELRSLGYVAD